MLNKTCVTVIPNGPLKISNVESFSYCGEIVETEPDVVLCRCGLSQNAPFCDGAHSREGFDDGCEEKAAKPIRTWEGQTVRTFFNPNACMHVFYCKPLKALRARELAGDKSAALEIVEVVHQCPSGALSYEEKEYIGEITLVPTGARIQVIEGAEVRLQWGFEINAPLMEGMAGDRGTLCRCGLSENKPWCDGKHKNKANFR